MKLEKLYHALQERYPVEQEKKAAAEKAAKEELKKEILTVINYAAWNIDDYSEEVYKAYEKAREEQESQEERVYITFQICEDYVDYTMHVNDKSASIARKFKANMRGHCEHINNLLRKLYCYASDKSCASSVEEKRVHFDYNMKFNLTESTISLSFSANPSTRGGFYEDERTIIEKFISDIKELFPNSEEIPEPSSYSVDLTVTLNCFGIEIKDLGKSEQNSESSSDDEEENDLVDKLKLLSMPIDSLDLCTRAIIALRRNGIYTIENLVQLSESELLDFSHIGPKAVDEIKQKLQEHGLTLKS